MHALSGARYSLLEEHTTEIVEGPAALETLKGILKATMQRHFVVLVLATRKHMLGNAGEGVRADALSLGVYHWSVQEIEELLLEDIPDITVTASQRVRSVEQTQKRI